MDVFIEWSLLLNHKSLTDIICLLLICFATKLIPPISEDLEIELYIKSISSNPSSATCNQSHNGHKYDGTNNRPNDWKIAAANIHIKKFRQP